MDLALRLGRRLSRSDPAKTRCSHRGDACAITRAFRSARIRGYRSDRRARGRGACRPGLAGQKHLPDSPAAWIVALSGSHRYNSRFRANALARRSPSARPLRKLYSLSGCLPHAGLSGTVRPRLAAFEPRETLFAPELEWLASLSQQEFSAVFRGSAVKRAKWRGLVRNACVALGNSGIT